MRIVLLGAPGSGKTTQAKRIAKQQGIPLISVGNLLKEFAARETPQGKQIQKLLEAGQAVPDEIIFEVLRERLSEDDARSGYVLSDFPRNIAQAHLLTKLLNEMGILPDVVLNIQIDNEALMERLVGRLTCSGCGQVYNIYTNPPIVDGLCDKCGTPLRQRSDDNETAISNRLRLYYSLIQPVVEYYRDQGKLQNIDGSESREKIFSAIKKVLKPISSPSAPARKSAPAKSEKKPIAKKKAAASKKSSTKKSAPSKKAVTKKTQKASKKTVTSKISKKKTAPSKPATSKKTAKAPASAKKKSAKKAAAPKKKAVKKSATKRKPTPKKAPTRKKSTVKKPATKKKTVTKKSTAKKKSAAKKKVSPKKKATVKKKR